MSIDAISRQKRKATGAETGRPVIAGVNHMVSSGHYLAAMAAFEILEAGGNATDAGVAGGIARHLEALAGVEPRLILAVERGAQHEEATLVITLGLPEPRVVPSSAPLSLPLITIKSDDHCHKTSYSPT